MLEVDLSLDSKTIDCNPQPRETTQPPTHPPPAHHVDPVNQHPGAQHPPLGKFPPTAGKHGTAPHGTFSSPHALRQNAKGWDDTVRTTTTERLQKLTQLQEWNDVVWHLQVTKERIWCVWVLARAGGGVPTLRAPSERCCASPYCPPPDSPLLTGKSMSFRAWALGCRVPPSGQACIGLLRPGFGVSREGLPEGRTCLSGKFVRIVDGDVAQRSA